MNQPTPRRFNPVVIALWANFGLLAVLVVHFTSQSRFPSVLPAAYGQQQTPNIAGGGGVYIMPAQLAQNQWGCYLLDVDSQDIVAYVYSPSDHKLRFVAARNTRPDRRLQNYSTEPSPREVQKMVDMETMTRKTEDAPAKTPEQSPNEPRQ